MDQTTHSLTKGLSIAHRQRITSRATRTNSQMPMWRLMPVKDKFGRQRKLSRELCLACFLPLVNSLVSVEILSPASGAFPAALRGGDRRRVRGLGDCIVQGNQQALFSVKAGSVSQFSRKAGDSCKRDQSSCVAQKSERDATSHTLSQK